VLILLVLLPVGIRADRSGGHMTGDLPEYHAEDPAAAVVTEENLLASERFWPYQVALIRPWQPVGRPQPLRPGVAGVLIRIEASGPARIDFGRDGLYEVPVGETDLVERANRIRRGELEKPAPNFLFAVGPRLVDSASSSLRPFRFEEAAEQRVFLSVFADPGAKDFVALAAALAPLRERRGALTILFPQGEHADSQVRERLRALKWTVPFVYDHLAEAYTPSLLAEGPPPAVLLVTKEGRTLFQSRWKPDVASKLTSAVEEALGSAPATASALDPRTPWRAPWAAISAPLIADQELLRARANPGALLRSRRGPHSRRKPSAIWLRAELPVQRTRTDGFIEGRAYQAVWVGTAEASLVSPPQRPPESTTSRGTTPRPARAPRGSRPRAGPSRIR
jgi:hypothetical protein